MEWQIIVALALAIPLFLVPLGLVSYISVGGIYKALLRRGKTIIGLTCAIDADCPQGYKCVGGNCVPAT
jgi:hypothetical protein